MAELFVVWERRGGLMTRTIEAMGVSDARADRA